MSTQTRTSRSTPTGTGRFTRASTPTSPPRTPARPTAPSRYGIAGGVLQRRKAPPPSNLKRALGGVPALLPAAGRASSKATPSSKGGKAGGFAIVTAVAGLAFKNREKLSALASRGEQRHDTPPPAPAMPSPTSPA